MTVTISFTGGEASNATSPSCAPSMRPINVTGVIFGGLKPLAVDPVRDPPGGHCFNCWQPGHSRRACPHPPRRGYCFNCGRREYQIANCPRCGGRHRARQQEWEARDSPTQGRSGGPHRGRPCIREESPRDARRSASIGSRTRVAERGEAPAQVIPPLPGVPAPVPGTAHYLAQILRDTRDVETEMRHQILRVVLGEGAAMGPKNPPALDQSQ